MPLANLHGFTLAYNELLLLSLLFLYDSDSGRSSSDSGSIGEDAKFSTLHTLVHCGNSAKTMRERNRRTEKPLHMKAASHLRTRTRNKTRLATPKPDLFSIHLRIC